MRKIPIKSGVALGVIYALFNLCAAQGDAAVKSEEEIRTIPSRTLPPPTTVSPQLRELLKGEYNNFPVPKTPAEWRKLGEIGAGSAHQDLLNLSNKFRVTVVARSIGGVPCYEITPHEIPPRNRNRLLVDLHAGGWLAGGGETSAFGAIVLSSLTGIRTTAVDYRLLPDHPYPAALDDATAVWKEVVKHRPPNNIGLSGSSAGGTTALSLVQRLIAQDLPLPGALLSDSAMSDLSKTGDSYYSNEGVDSRIPKYDGLLEANARLYANGLKLDDPAVSPLYGNFKGFPPTFLVSGTRDLFLSNTVRLQSKLLAEGVPTQLLVGEALPHGIIQEAAMKGIPEALQIYSYIARFFDERLGQ